MLCVKNQQIIQLLIYFKILPDTNTAATALILADNL